MPRQNAVFRRFGLGSFKTMVFAVTRDPAMLEFLDGNRNTVGTPNENTATISWRLHHRHIALIEEWIAVRAPESGFVTVIGAIGSDRFGVGDHPTRTDRTRTPPPVLAS